MKVLIYENRKTNPIVFDVSTEEKMNDALLALFNHLDVDWCVYFELTEPSPPLPEAVTFSGYCPAKEVRIEVTSKCPQELLESYDSPCPVGCGGTHTMKIQLDGFYLEAARHYRHEKPLYDAARKGDVVAIRTLLHARRDSEYEGFQIIETMDPMKLLGETIQRRKNP